jgi:hypothetical protein
MNTFITRKESNNTILIMNDSKKYKVSPGDATKVILWCQFEPVKIDMSGFGKVKITNTKRNQTVEATQI